MFLDLQLYLLIFALHAVLNFAYIFGSAMLLSRLAKKLKLRYIIVIGAIIGISYAASSIYLYNLDVALAVRVVEALTAPR